MSSLEFARHKGEMARLIGSFDWSRTSIGPVTEWPQHLRSAVDIMLGADLQIVMFWGPQFLALYNDAYAPTIGDKHPHALGRPAREYWAELWTDLEPLLKRVLETGETVSAKDRPFYIERGRGPETVYFDISYSPVHDATGSVAGVFCIVNETTELRRAQVLQRRLAAIIASTDDAILSADLDMTITSWNRGAERLYGYGAEEMVGWSVLTLIPEDQGEEEYDLFRRIGLGEHVPPYETRRRRRDGTLVDVSLTVSPIYGGAGEIIGASKIARDITAKKQFERFQAMAMGELKHRIKNILSTVTAIARQTFVNGDDERDAVRTFDERLASLARAHDLLTTGNWEEADLRTVIDAALQPYAPDRFRIEGPAINVGAHAVTALTLAFHELATNAAKYGALSREGGIVCIRWHGSPDTVRFKLQWREEGGPDVVVPTRRGFGSKLIERLLAAELNGEVRLDFAPSGLICDVDASLRAEISGS
ncbi:MULTISPECIES: sensor histidine kinase [unclassified Shinella]|uniref:sensor histidine kinase n=2 Tax=Shinella TaxID=323620 RepID=UPI00234EC5C3|nr:MULTISPECIES: PAS domain S-box protein [unclassified Shinella]MCO5148472.1 PAS domain S-box protein [Shinella sp.]